MCFSELYSDSVFIFKDKFKNINNFFDRLKLNIHMYSRHKNEKFSHQKHSSKWNFTNKNEKDAELNSCKNKMKIN